MRKTLTISVLLATVLVVRAASSAPICGDVNNNGQVTSSDALAVLKKAVGQAIELSCPGGAQPVRTGQTVSFGSGSDGDVKAGAARQFVDNGDGTITDQATGLMWEKKDRSGGIHDAQNTYNWSVGASNMDGTMVTDFLAALDAGEGFAGHTDWRIPNVTELETLKNYGAAFAAFSEFDSDCTAACTVMTCSCTRVGSYWTSTTHTNNPVEAWTVAFNGPGTEAEGKTGGFNGVRAVRNAS